MLGRDRGLVLRILPLGETSLIVSVLAREHGRLRLVARGVRGPRGRAGASLEAGNEIDFVFSARPDRDLGTLREVVLVRPWLGGLRRLEAMAVGLAALELLEAGVPEGAAEEGLLDAAWSFLATLTRVRERASALMLFYAFELQLLARCGLAPELQACRACGGGPTAHVLLDALEASWICGRCAHPGAGPLGLRLPGAVVQVLQAMSLQPWEAGELETTLECRRLVGRTMHRLLTAHLERYHYPRAFAMLQKVDSRDERPEETPEADRNSADPS